ncbi:FG-GAP-like repeat-containing protein [Winogradskyella sp.]|uniref:FG-GAP-like repeat-containing protein n=2 Tax=Winogradskyella sp. TaxID=1883156 RepID=UPI003517B214
MIKIKYFIVLLSYSVINGQIDFQNQASARGVGYSCGNIEYGGGISFYDYNNDGWDDITLATENNANIKIFKNNQDGFFIPETTLIPVNNFQQKQVVWVDFDNDGDNDLFITSNVQGNRLYRNDTIEFTDITVAAGLPLDNLFTFGASWGDFNNDGFLDLYICNRDLNLTIPNFLFKNNGDSTFVNVNASSGIGMGSHLSLCAAFFDYNNDGWQDIYVANDKTQTQNLLYHNNGDGTFIEIGESSGTNVTIDAMSTTIGDYNNDGWFDIYVTNGIQGNVFFKNNADGTFSNISSTSGTSFNSAGWGAVFLDADNDSDLDLYVSGSLDGTNPSFLSAAFYENLSNDSFLILNNGSFNNDNSESYANAIGDIDNDGYPEIVVSNSNNDDLFLWKNSSTQNNNWLKIKLQGTISNKQGIGSLIEISINGEKQYRYTLCGEGYLGQNSNSEFFGLGADTVIDYIKVTWLSGMQDILYNVDANQSLTIIEGSNTLSIEEFNKRKLVVYPNPTSDYLYVATDNKNYIDFEILDLGGRSVSSGNILSSEKITVSNLVSGNYFIKLKIDDRFFIKRFFKH